MTELLNKQGLDKERVKSTEERIRIRRVYPGDNERLEGLLKCAPLPDTFSLGRYMAHPGWLPNRHDGPTSEQVIFRVATERDHVIAVGYLTRPKVGPLCRVGEVSIVTDVDHRNRGLGRLLFEEFLEVAKDLELKRLVVKLVADRKPDQSGTLKVGGRIRLTVLKSHYRDSARVSRDLVVLEMPAGRVLEESERRAFGALAST